MEQSRYISHDGHFQPFLQKHILYIPKIRFEIIGLPKNPSTYQEKHLLDNKNVPVRSRVIFVTTSFKIMENKDDALSVCQI